MKTMSVGDLKARFSDVMEEVKKGEEIVISHGKRKRKIAVIVPYERYRGRNRIRLGVLRGKASVEFADDFSMTTDELLGG